MKLQSKGLRILISGFITMIIFSLILMLIVPSSNNIRFPSHIQHPRAFIIGIDGIGNLPKTVDTPGIHRVINNGVYTFNAQTVHPSLSSESWTSLLHGVGPEKHRIYTDFEVNGDSHVFKEPNSSFSLTSNYPSIFRQVHAKDDRASMACFSNWEFIPKYVIEDDIGVFKFFTRSEKELVDSFEKYMETNDPWLVFFQLDDCDEAGHKHGFFSKEQKEQLIITDMSVSRIIDIIEKYDRNNESLILIQTDHGGGGSYFAEKKIERPSFICETCMHGSRDPADMTIFWTARGKGICRSKEIGHAVSIKDTARFVASYLKLRFPETWDGYDLYSELQC